MFEKSTAELTQMGGEITTREIKQQPELWQETRSIYEENKDRITQFLNKVKESTNEKIHVIFTGAGTSQYVGDTITPYLTKAGDQKRFVFESIGTTNIVAYPEEYLNPDTPTILVSFARSGNSPESVATVEIAKKFIKHLYQITITCAKDGALAKAAQGDSENLLLLMPERSNDQGFAMTGSYSCMSLTALLVFDETSTEKEKADYVDALSALGNEVVARENEIQKVINKDYNRIVYLGSGSLAGLTREAQLKVLELTAGKITTCYDSSMGFRHGPKSFVDEKTLVFDFTNNNDYTRQYDIDILEEIHADKIAASVVAIGQKHSNMFTGDNFTFTKSDIMLPDGYLAIADVMYAQTVSLLSSIKVGNTPDTPSPSGTVNRVVKGVTIHKF